MLLIAAASWGALIAGLLDIKLLELSRGEHGLRDLVTDLSRSYGKRHAFAEDSLIAVIVRRTSPEVGEFFARYVQGAEHPPIREYYAKLGIDLVEDEQGLPVRLELDPNPTAEQQRLRSAWMGRKPVVP
jgi:predicted metalloprotease with PDZ domain